MDTGENKITLADQCTGKEALLGLALIFIGIVLIQLEVTQLAGGVLCGFGGKSIGIGAERNRQKRVNELSN